MIKQWIKTVFYPILKARPDCLIIGAQKAGTTSLYRYLSQHPQVLQNNTWKEVRYFDVPENYRQGMGWYLGNFPFKYQKKDRLTFDASPSYLYFQFIPELIKKDLGDVKMIGILRNPVDRAYSAWQMYHSFAKNPHEHLLTIADLRTFPEAVEQELNPSTNTATYPYDYINRGKYFDQIQNYYQYFDKKNILILDFNQFKQDLSSLLNQVCNFLGMDNFSPEKLQEFQQIKYNVGKYKYEKTFKDQETLDYLKNYFQPFNQKLFDLLNYDYNWQ